MKKFFEKKDDVLCIVYLGILTIIGVSLALNRSIWLDESLSLRWSGLPFITMMKVLIQDVHPPLFYILLKAIRVFAPDSIIWSKLFVVAGFTFTILPSYFFQKKKFGKAPMFLYTLFLISLPMMLIKIVEIRMYTWAMFFVVMTAVFAYKVMEEPVRRNWIGFVIFGLATAYTHYYGLLSMVFFYPMLLLYFLVGKKWTNVKQWFIYSIITAVGYLPWLPIAIDQVTTVNNDYWIKESSLMSYLKGLFRVDAFPHSTKIYFGIIFLFVIYLFFMFIKKKEREYYWGFACAIPLICTMIFGLIYGKLVKPIMVERYLLIPLCLLIFGISIVARDLNKYVVGLICIFCAVMLLLNYPVVFDKEYNTPTEKTLSFFEEKIDSEATIFLTRSDLKTVIMFYMPDAKVELCKELEDISGNHDNFWFFDHQEFVNQNASVLEQYSINKYENYGLDDAPFTIYYFSKK